MAAPFITQPPRHEAPGMEHSSTSNVHYLHPPTAEGVSLPEKDVDQATNLTHGVGKVGDNEFKWTLEVPKELLYPGYVVAVAGFGGIKRSSRAGRHTDAINGFAELTFEPLREGEDGIWELIADPQKLHVDAISAVVDSVADSKRLEDDIPNADDMDRHRVIVKPHSMGGLAAARWTLQNTDSVDMLFNLMTVGFGSPTIKSLAQNLPTGTLGSIRHELIPGFRDGSLPRHLKGAREILHYYARLRAVAEGLSCILESTTEQTESIRDEGVPIAYVAAKHDILVPPVPEMEAYADLYIELLRAGHLAPIVKSGLIATCLKRAYKDLVLHERTTLQSV